MNQEFIMFHLTFVYQIKKFEVEEIEVYQVIYELKLLIYL